MAATGERRGTSFDPERALFLYDQINAALSAREKAGEIYVGRSPISAPWRSSLGERSFIIAPWKPNYDASALTAMVEGLVPGIEPSYFYGPTNTDPREDGMHFGHASYASVPGYTVYYGEVTVSPHITHEYASDMLLRDLERSLGADGKDFVVDVGLRIYPDPYIADFLLEYEKGLAEGRLPYTPLMNEVASWLSPSRFRYYRENPDDFFAWLKEQIEVARNYNGVRNLSLSEPDGWRPRP